MQTTTSTLTPATSKLTQATSTLTSAEELMFLGTRCRILATSDSTDGTYGLVDMIQVPAGDMAPLHVHHTHDEGFLVLEGEVSLFLPGREIALRPGEFVLAPRGVPHTYQVGEAPARWLNISTPASFEQFVEDVAALDEVTPAALAAAAAERGIEILGPPGTMP